MVDTIVCPAIVSFTDEGVADVLCIAFKKDNHGTKIAAVCVDLPLQIAAKNGDKPAVWVAFKAASSVKMDVIKSFKPLERHDGSNQIKAFEEWLSKSPSPNPLRELGFKKLKDIRSYLAAGNFKNVVKKVCDATTVRLRKEVKQAAGGEKASKKASKSAAAAEVTATELEEVERRVKEVDCARAHLMTLEPFYAAPLGARLIECAIPPANQDGTIDTAALEAMVTAESSKEICAKLLEVIRKQEIVKLLTEGKGSVKYASPFLVKPSPETNERPRQMRPRPPPPRILLTPLKRMLKRMWNRTANLQTKMKFRQLVKVAMRLIQTVSQMRQAATHNAKQRASECSHLACKIRCLHQSQKPQRKKRKRAKSALTLGRAFIRETLWFKRTPG